MRCWLVVLSLCCAAAWADDWRLKTVCPPGFVSDSGVCRFSSLYSDYPSLQDAGMGGLKVGLPTPRDGFTAQQIDLGRLLFFDPMLSGDGSVSCASCHQPDKGFTDGRALSRGIHGQTAERSAPSLWNVGFLQTLFWDARASSLEQQLLGPLYAEHEMGNTPEQLLASLRGNPIYTDLFKQAFGDKGLTLDTIYTALAAFEASLISLNSRYDLYAHGFHEVLSEPEIEGMNIFRSFVARCGECHTPPLFTNQQLAVLGTPEPAGRPLDIGAEGPTGDRSLRGGFKVPTLRNIELTAPYMHSGRFKTLRETVEFYTKGRGHAVPEGEHLSIHWHIWDPKLTDTELDRLVDFLKTLTDQSFMPVIPERVPSGLSVADALDHSETVESTPVAMGDSP
ncbi:MAG: cytochrome-c peroxidase [Spongiibacteraceae bacterium]|jgi:cytochrome c peroxidase|nr:cytochrome-c peroxidase [Spongiibacteraceae bacterium]